MMDEDILPAKRKASNQHIIEAEQSLPRLLLALLLHDHLTGLVSRYASLSNQIFYTTQTLNNHEGQSTRPTPINHNPILPP
jgi:hypothetical protein